jgi:hypothetical protein
MLEQLSGFAALWSEGVSRFHAPLAVHSLLSVRNIVVPFGRAPLCGRWRTRGNTTSRPRVDRRCCTLRSGRLHHAHVEAGRGSCEEGAVIVFEAPGARFRMAGLDIINKKSALLFFR